MRRLTSVFNFIAVAMTVALLTIIVVHTNLVTATEQAMQRSSRYDSAWVGAAGRMEILYLQKALGNFLVSKDRRDADQVALFSEILANRFSIYNAPGFQAFMDMKPKRRHLIETAAVEYGELRPLLHAVETLDAPALAALRQKLERVFAAVDRVGAEAQADSVNEAAQIRAEMQAKQKLQTWLVSGLFGSIALLLGISTLQNRFLRSATRTALRSAVDFSYLAHHDSLTGLPNRMAFTAEFARAAASCGDCECTRIAVLAVDLDGFKNVNDRLGHAAGDALLKEVAERMTRTCATFENNLLTARIGGDEFVVMLDASGDAALIFAQAEQLRAVLSETYAIEGSSLIVGASVGVAISVPGRDPNSLLIDADIALSQAKGSGKGRVMEFDPAMHDIFIRRASIEAELASAIAKDEIIPHYQIKMDVASGRVRGVEALARWTHPTLGPVSPGEFTRIAEESGLIVALGRNVLQRACRDALCFPEEVGVAVNLSAIQFIRDDILGTVRDVLDATGLPAHRLTLEVTETLMISETDRAVDILSRFRDMGVSIALDDFGTGYSALSYLRQFPWDELKIDRAFVMEMETDERARSIVGSIAAMAHQLGINVTAEGAETPGQIEALRDAGCETIQGYHFGRPVPFDDLPRAILHGVAAAARLHMGEATGHGRTDARRRLSA
ncbi:EAL domain-containing protein [Hoeflea sp. BAL378]|uniref:putative bifunctional diguanylate cyclase/phosphodiesterase n=1 Tax=Hoeflea sp. BAL378 TaxID=1547437 RepID=UPI00068F3810|nr:EAL domain-containing protein [Hoeflea sp. BAL378]